MGYVDGKYEGIRMNRRKNAKADLCVRLQDRFTYADLRNRFRIECIGDIVRSSRLRWLGHVERKQKMTNRLGEENVDI